MWRDGRAELHERYRAADSAWRSVHHVFSVAVADVADDAAAEGCVKGVSLS